MSIIRCLSCDALSNQSVKIKNGLSALCPCCHDKLSKPDHLSLSGELALSLAAFILFFPALYFNLVTNNLLGVELSTTVSSGAIAIFSTYPIVAILVLFCAVIAPFAFLIAIFLAHLSLYLGSHKSLSISTMVIKNLRGWVMIDVFLVSLGIACFKVNDVTPVIPSQGLLCFVLLHISLTILLSRVSIRRFWDQFKPEENFTACTDRTQYDQNLTCRYCNLTQNKKNTHCLRCHQTISLRKKQSLQKAWAYLITAIIFVFPANIYSISILLKNGKKLEDTIMSGVIALINDGMYGIALIIFTASIIVPIAKILGLAYILYSIHIKQHRYFRTRAKLYRFVNIIGKWSMVDLFVITIMVSLIDQGKLLDFIPGFASNAFGLVVIFTMLATKSLDSRLIWDTGDRQKLAKYYRLTMIK